MSDRIAEIRARWAKATPWRTVMRTVMLDGSIVTAPDDVVYLLARVEELETEAGLRGAQLLAVASALAGDPRWTPALSEARALRARVEELEADRDAWALAASKYDARAEAAEARCTRERDEARARADVIDEQRLFVLSTVNDLRAKIEEAGRLREATLAEVERLAARVEELEARLRLTNQILVEAVGADSPDTAEKAAARAADRLKRMEAVVEAARRTLSIAHHVSLGLLADALRALDEEEGTDG